ncbi:MAG: DUF2442 domain-containing protein [Chromatiaceae bacterium]|nr:DUF2442 domain-containing protein [Chromatiaceae bacterium]
MRTLSVLPGYCLAVTFQDGVSGVADLSRLTSASDFGVFEPLKDQDYFSQARLELGTVTWPNGADLDPAWVHDEIARAKTWSVPEVSPQIAPRAAPSRSRASWSRATH